MSGSVVEGWVPPARRGRGRPPTRREEVLTEWAHVRCWVPFRDFPTLVGMTFEAWERMYYRARKARDPRAVRADEVVPGWAA